MRKLIFSFCVNARCERVFPRDLWWRVTQPRKAQWRAQINDQVLSGVRVLEVAAWTFVPSAGAVLAEWGAEVIKVEPLRGGDPQRGLVTMGIVDGGGGSVNYMIEIPNRGKKSIGIDLLTEGGQEVIRELAKTCDVFLTSYLPSRRTRLGIDVDDIRSVNPNIVYVRGSGHGPKGPRFGQAGV